MPVKHVIHDPPTKTALDLQRRIAEEWRNPNSPAAEPIILEDKGGAPNTLHVYVILNDWHGLKQADRSDVILDAFEDAFGGTRKEYITLVMGLTPVEAERLNIRYH